MKLENLLNKPLWQMTGEEFIFLSKSASSESKPKQADVVMDVSAPKYVYGLSGIAQLFGCSIPTANRIKKSGKIDKEVCKEMQTVLAESLAMERGTPKEDTGIEGLSAIEYKEKMATAHVRQLKQEQEELESRNAELTREQENKETEIAELEVRRIEKQKALDAESGSALKSGLANIFGKGKYAEIERENTRLQSEIHFYFYLSPFKPITKHPISLPKLGVKLGINTTKA